MISAIRDDSLAILCRTKYRSGVGRYAIRMVGIMGRNFVGALLAGVTSAVIWMAFALIAGLDGVTIGVWSLVMLVGVLVISFIISTVVNRGRESS